MKIVIGQKVGDIQIVDAQGRDVLKACRDRMIDIHGFELDVRAGAWPTLKMDGVFRGAELELPVECVGMDITCHTPTPKAKQALVRIAEIIERVDHRAQFGDIVTPTLQEMRQEEIQEIFDLASGKKEMRRDGTRLRAVLVKTEDAG